MGSSDSRDIGLFELLFMSVWLLIWTTAVSVLQGVVISQGFQIVGLFLFTHGGAEVWVISSLSRRLRTAAENSTEAPEIDLDHAGLRARWSEGNGQLSVFILGAIIGLVVHGMLIGSAVMSVANTTGLAGALIGLGMVGVWLYTGTRWAGSIFAHLRTRQVIELDADLDRVRISRGDERVELPLVGLKVVAEGDDLMLGSSSLEWRGRCAVGESRDEMVEMLDRMASRAVQPDVVAVPERLHRLRQEEA